MNEWTPIELFGFAVAFSAITALGALLDSDKPLTPRSVLATMLFHGMMGGGLGMAAYEYLSWQNKAWRVLVTAIMYGGGVISFKWLQKIVQRNIQGVLQGDPDEQNKP